jgi:type I restriction enzyme, R subunit
VALSEADIRVKLIDPAIHGCGWSEDMICRETTLGAVEIIAGKARRRSGGRTDYTLRVRVSTEAQPVAVALQDSYHLQACLPGCSVFVRVTA